jgi:hypothetical protein
MSLRENADAPAGLPSLFEDGDGQVIRELISRVLNLSS